MATVTGVTGSVTIPHECLGMFNGTTGDPRTDFNEPDDILHLAKWTASTDRDVFDISNWGSVAVPDLSNAREKIGGPYHLTGSAEGFLPSSAALDIDPWYPTNAAGDQQEGIPKPDAQPVAGFVLRYNTGVATDREITFVGIISNIEVTSEKQGLNRYKFSFESHEDITSLT